MTTHDPLGRLVTSCTPDDVPTEVLARMSQADLVAVDVETTGVTWHDDLRLVQLGTQHEALVLRADVPTHMDALRQWFAETDMALTAHNAGFDIGFLVRAGLGDHKALWDRMVDTLILDKLLRPGDGWTSPKHDLKSVTRAWCGDAATADDAKDELEAWWASLGIAKDAGWRDCPLDGVPYVLYGAADVFDGWTLATTLLPMVDGLLGREVRYREHRIARLVHGITMRGHRLDIDALRADTAAAKVADADRKTALTKRYGIKNPGSNPQITDWFGDRGIAIESTSEEALAALDLSGAEAEFRRDLLEWREGHKLLSTYLEPWSATPADPDGHARLRPSLGTLAARTGRMSCDAPNLQNVPPQLRKYLLAEPGNVLIGADFSAVEVRIAAAFARDQALAQTFLAGEDPYTAAAAAAWGDSDDPDTAKAQRNRAKPLLLGHIYGRGANSVAGALNISSSEAQRLQTRLNAAMPEVPKYVARARSRVAMGKTAGKLPGGSGRLLQTHPAAYYTSAVNSGVQGYGRELLVNALLALDDAGLGDAVWLPIHDEWLLQVETDQVEEATSLLEQAMTQTVMGVPVTAEAELVGTAWRKT